MDQRDLDYFAASELKDVEHKAEVAIGPPTSAILARAAEWNADLICMSTHGWTGLKRMHMGSVAEKVLRGAHCATWIVRTPSSELRS